MVRAIAVLLAGALVALTGLVGAADKPADAEKAKPEAAAVVGNWKVVIPAFAGDRPLWLLKLTEQDGKFTGEVSPNEKVPPATIEKLVVAGGTMTFTFKVGAANPEVFSFEIAVPKAASEKLLGAVTVPDKSMETVALEKTPLKKLDAFELNKEILAKNPDGPEAVRAGLDLLQAAKAKKAKKEEIAAWADKTVKGAEKFGLSYQRYAISSVAKLLGPEEEFADLGVEYARKAEKLLTAKDKPLVHKRTLEQLAAALETAGKKDEVKAVNEKIKKLDMSLKPEMFAGRKAKSDRVVLVELFTGAQCPPCVAADLAFDALAKSYKRSEVVLLEYHLHVPGPDPLANEETDERANYYGKLINGTPTILFNGTPGAEGGGGSDDAPEKYDEYTALIDPQLEMPAELKVTATATQKGGKIDVQAEVTAPQKPEDRLRLRMVLIEEKVDYTGGNKISEHRNVVRAFPGGTEGFAMKEKTLKTSASIDVEELKKDLKKYLDKYGKKDPFPTKDQPLELKKLKVVAFVQNQETREIVQAVQIDVKTAE